MLAEQAFFIKADKTSHEVSLEIADAGETKA